MLSELMGYARALESQLMSKVEEIDGAVILLKEGNSQLTDPAKLSKYLRELSEELHGARDSADKLLKELDALRAEARKLLLFR